MISVLAARELRTFFLSPLAWLVLAVLQFILAWLFLNQIDAYLVVQPQFAQFTNPPGVTETIAAPLFGSAAVVLLMTTPILGMRLIAGERHEHTLPLLLSAPISMTQLVLGKFCALATFLILIVILPTVMALSLRLGGSLDVGMLLANLLGLILLAKSFAALGGYASSLANRPASAAFAALGLLIGLWVIGAAAPEGSQLLPLLSPLHHFEAINRGLIAVEDIVFFALFIATFLLLTRRRLDAAYAREQRSRRLRRALTTAVLPIAAFWLVILAHQHLPYRWDVTGAARHTLTSASLNVLAALPGTLTLTAYAPKQDARQGDLRKLIRAAIAPYQQAKPDLVLNFVDPAEQPQAARAAGIRANGEITASYRDRNARITALNEATLTNALMRLARTQQRLVLTLEGHGERRLDGIANHDLGTFGGHLASKGFRVGNLNLALAQEVPDNLAFLLITHPQIDLLPGEIDKIRRYLDKGGNLLWLIDPEPLHGLQALTEILGLALAPGVVVDPAAARQLQSTPTTTLGTNYGHHPITLDFTLATVFPAARPVSLAENTRWRATPLIEVAPRGWVETGTPTGAPTLDPQRDTPGPVNIAVALERPVEDKAQRVVVVGNGAFLSNTYLGNGGNLDLGINLANWLSGDENLIAIQPKATPDAKLELDKTAAALIAIGFLIALPLGFLSIAGWIWWRRR